MNKSSGTIVPKESALVVQSGVARKKFFIIVLIGAVVRIIIVTLLLLFGQFYGLATAESTTSKTYDVIIVGGGIAGLTAAYYLDDHDVLLLEMQKQVGGRATSGQYQNLSFARGAEYIGKPEEPLSEIIDELGLKLREIPSPADAIYHRGSFYYGEQGKARLLIDKSSFHDLKRFAGTLKELYNKYDEIPELELQGELARLDTISAKQWFDENHFPKIFYEIYNVTSRGLFGAGLGEISALAALPELAFDVEGFDEADDGTELLGELGKSPEFSGMYTFDRGIAEIPQAMAQDLADSIRTGAKVTWIAKAGELFEVHFVQDGKKEQVVRAKTVIVATPAPVALKIGAGILDDQQKELLATVKYAPYITVALFSDRPIFDKGFDLAVEDGHFFTDIYDATWVSRYFKPCSTSKKDTRITLVYATPLSLQDKNFLQRSDHDFLTRVLATLNDVLPGSSASVTGHDISRFNYGLPVMTPGSYQRMITLNNISGDGVFLAGDYLIYPTFEAASASGQSAAEKVEEWLKD